MNNQAVIDSLLELEAMADLFQRGISVLKKELEDDGALSSSAPRGSISEHEKLRIAKHRKRILAKKAIGKDGSKSNAKSNH